MPEGKFANLKSPGLAPESVRSKLSRVAMSIPTGAAVLFVKVTTCETCVELRRVGAKSSSVGDAVKPEVTARRTLRSGGVCGCDG